MKLELFEGSMKRFTVVQFMSSACDEFAKYHL
jgi:hypothetical protein